MSSAGGAVIDAAEITYSENVTVTLDQLHTSDAEEPALDEGYYCQVCCEEFKEGSRSGFDLSCKHRFCRECLEGYLSCSITDGDVGPKCFWCGASVNLKLQTWEMANAKDRCDVPICEADMKALLLPGRASIWDKYERFKFFKSNPLARECPYCQHRQLCVEENSRAEKDGGRSELRLRRR